MKFESNDLNNDELRAAYEQFTPSGNASPGDTERPTPPAAPEPVVGSGAESGPSLADALSETPAPASGTPQGQPADTSQPSPGTHAARDDVAPQEQRPRRIVQPPAGSAAARHAPPQAPDPMTPPPVPRPPGRGNIPTAPPEFNAWRHAQHSTGDTSYPAAAHDPQQRVRPADGAGAAPTRVPDHHGAPTGDPAPRRSFAPPASEHQFNPPTGPIGMPPSDLRRPPRSVEPQPPSAGWPPNNYPPSPARQPGTGDPWGHDRVQQGFQADGSIGAPRRGDPFTPDHGDSRGKIANRSQREEGPQQGWRRTLHRLHLPVSKGQAEKEYDLDIAKINKVLRYPKVIGFASPKGGVGKTISAMAVGSTIAAHRHKGGVVAIDTDHNGSLARRVGGSQNSHIKAFANDDRLSSTNDIASHMQSNHHRLSVLGASWEPLDDPLSPDDYLRVLETLQAGHLFTIVDMDTSAATPAYDTIMRSLDALVIVTATALDSAQASQDMIKWLRARGLTELIQRTIVLINHQSPAKPYLDLQETVNHFHKQESLEVLEIPWDEHLAEAGPINLELLNKATRRQFVKVAAHLVDSLPSS